MFPRWLHAASCVLLAAATLTACGDFADYGHDFDMAKVSLLKPGIATGDDAKKLFGEPTSVESAKDSDHVLYEWTYGYYSMGASHIKHLAISFDGTGHMIKVVTASG